MTHGTPPQPGQAGGHTWYGSGNAPPPQTFGPPPAGGAAFGFGPAQPGGPGWGGGGPQAQPTGLVSNELVLAGVAHLSAFFAPLLAPLLIWLLARDNMPYASRQGKQAFFFHLLCSGISVVVSLIFFAAFFLGFLSVLSTASTSNGSPVGVLVAFPIWFFLYFGVVALLSLVYLGGSIYAAIQAFQGKPFSYPFLARL